VFLRPILGSGRPERISSQPEVAACPSRATTRQGHKQGFFLLPLRRLASCATLDFIERSDRIGSPCILVRIAQIQTGALQLAISSSPSTHPNLDCVVNAVELWVRHSTHIRGFCVSLTTTCPLILADYSSQCLIRDSRGEVALLVHLSVRKARVPGDSLFRKAKHKLRCCRLKHLRRASTPLSTPLRPRPHRHLIHPRQPHFFAFLRPLVPPPVAEDRPRNMQRSPSRG
jgi:hypothetical protein